MKRRDIFLINNEVLLENVVKACEDRKGENCVILNMTELTPMADYYVICHGNNERQVQAIAKSVKEVADQYTEITVKVEGFEKGRWVLIDLGDIVCHVFHKEERDYYHLEKLWGDATKITVGDEQ